MTAFVSDNASYMCKAYETFKIIWPNSVHITCHSHISNLDADTFRSSFAKVDSFLAKTIFQKVAIKEKKFF
jgi:hypothetical protein